MLNKGWIVVGELHLPITRIWISGGQLHVSARSDGPTPPIYADTYSIYGPDGLRLCSSRPLPGRLAWGEMNGFVFNADLDIRDIYPAKWHPPRTLID
jgi:hypothetical protein